MFFLFWMKMDFRFLRCDLGDFAGFRRFGGFWMRVGVLWIKGDLKGR